MQWLQHHEQPTQDDILHFHQFAGDGDTANDLRMNRNEFMLTVSVTSIAMTKDTGIMKYLDLKDNSITVRQIPFTATSAAIS